MVVILLYLQRMKNIHLHIEVNPELYLKNPNATELGRRIVSEGVRMIHELGFEAFTFKKLGEKIDSSESSIYRYFESKHNLLIYLVSWYWVWAEYMLVFYTANIEDPKEKLVKAIRILTGQPEKTAPDSEIDIRLLSDIIITESVKAFHTKDVDVENGKGYFKSYKKVVNRVVEMILMVNPDYQYPRMLVSTIIEGAHQQRYFAVHLPSLTDTKEESDVIPDFYLKMLLRLIG